MEQQVHWSTYQTTRRELSDVIIGEKSIILEFKIRNSKSEFHALGIFGHTMPFTVRHSITEDAHTPFGRENHRYAFGF
jgi:hypothetical protein